MAENVVLNNLANLQNDTTTISVINGNNATITTAFSDVLSRTGIQPNQMGAAIDMNNWPIMNLPAPGSANSPARLQDITTPGVPINISLSLAGDATAPASSGVLTTTVGKVNGVTYPASPSTNTVPVVTGANTVAYQQITSAQIANNTIVAADIVNNTITATQLANNTVGNGQFRQSAGLSAVGNTGTTTANVADITGTTRQVLAVNTAGTALTFAQPQGDQLKGTITNDNATAGNVGEYVFSTVLQGSASALTTAVALNVTSITLTAGDWDIWANVCFIPVSGCIVTSWTGSISTTSATNNLVSPFFTQFFPNGVNVTATALSYHISPVRVSLTGSTTYFLVAQSAFTTQAQSAFGTIAARRVR